MLPMVYSVEGFDFVVCSHCAKETSVDLGNADSGLVPVHCDHCRQEFMARNY